MATPQRRDAPLSGPGADRRGSDFSAFYRAEVGPQVRRATLLLGSDELANDVVHDAFVALYERWDRIADPGPYLHRTVLNGCRAAARRAGRWRALIPRLVERGPADRDEVLWDVLESLPFNQRAAVVLRFYADLGEREIAEVLGCSPGSVGPWITRAKNTMRKALR